MRVHKFIIYIVPYNSKNSSLKTEFPLPFIVPVDKKFTVGRLFRFLIKS